MRKTKTNIFFESKLIFAKRKEGGLWEEEKRDEKGLGVSESVITEFETYYRPDNLDVARDHPEEIVHGVRDRMMQGPLGTTNILSGGSILERRVLGSLERVSEDAPRLYKQMINEEVRRGATPLEIARNMFTYNINTGGSYNDLLTTLQGEIMALGHIGPATFTDNRGQRINLANPTQINEFDVVNGAPGTSGNVTVIINWHQEDLTTIRQKLEQANMWAEFSRQGGAREFLHLKFRQTLIDRVVQKEKTKLSKDKFDPQRLKSWLDDDLHQRALRNPGYVTWYTDWCATCATARAARGATRGTTQPLFQALSAADLTAAERNELSRNQREARERVQNDCLEAKLKKILIPGEIENVTKSLETRTMLAYLFYKMRNAKDRENVENYIDELAGADHSANIDTLGSVSETVAEFIEQTQQKMESRNAKAAESTGLEATIGVPGVPGVPPTPGTGLYAGISLLELKITAEETLLTTTRKSLTATPPPTGAQLQTLKSLADTLAKNIDLMEKRKTAIEERIRTLTKEKSVVDKDLVAMDNELIKDTKTFGDYLNEQSANTALWGASISHIVALNTSLTTINSAATPVDKIVKKIDFKDTIIDA